MRNILAFFLVTVSAFGQATLAPGPILNGGSVGQEFGSGPYSPSSFTANNILTGNGTGAIQASGATITNSGNTLTFVGGSRVADSSGQITIAAAGTNQNVVLTPSGSGLVSSGAVIQGPVGTSSAPTYGFPGATANYGMYYSSSAIYFTANGSNVLHLDSGKLATFAGGVTLSGSNIVTTPNITMGSGTGSVTAASGVFSVTSDRRAKNAHGNFTLGLDAIRHLHPVLYDFKKDPKHLERAGFYTQDVEPFIPQAVFHDSPDGLGSLDDRPVEAALVNSVKELDSKSGYDPVARGLAAVGMLIAIAAHFRPRSR